MEEDGLSLLDIWYFIMRKKILASIAFGISMLVAFIFLIFIYNPMHTTYEVKFHYQWYGIEENKYANGILYNYYDIISLENLEKVKEKNAAYHSINTQKLAEDISIEANENEYRILVGGSHFKSDSIAKAFLEDLVYLPYETALNLKFDFNANLTGYTRAKKMSTKLTYLQQQLDQIVEGYQGMISYFGDIQINETNLSNRLNEAQVFVANEDLDNYEYLAYQNVYLTKEEYQTILADQNSLLTEQKLLRDRKSILLESLSSIYNNSNGNTYMDTSIANYLNSLHTIDTRLISISENLRLMEQVTLGKYDESQSEAFLKELDTYKEKVEKLTNTYTESVNSVLKENTIINLQPIRAKGRINMALSICISLLFGIVVGLLITFVWSYFTNYRDKDTGIENNYKKV